MTDNKAIAGPPRGAGRTGLALLAALGGMIIGTAGTYYIGFGYIAHTGRGSIWWSLAGGVILAIASGHVMYRQGWTGRR